MHEIVQEDGRFLSTAKLHGSGVFTTVAIHSEKPVLWEKHWRRLTSDAAKLQIDISDFTEEALFDQIRNEIEKTNLNDGRARITFLDDSPSEIWSSGGEKKTSLSIITGAFREIPASFRLTVSPHRVNTTSPLVGIKSCNYLEHLLAFEEARKRGHNEAIRLNERGEVASACMANVFWLKDERLFTPSLSTGCLAGTTREFVLENLECDEVETGLEALQKADAIFLTSAGLGIVQVAAFERRSLAPTRHPITELWPKL